MKKLYLTLLCATALTCGSHLASAQLDNTMPPPPPHMERNIDIQKNMEKHHEKMAKKLAEELNLTEEQQAKAQHMRKNAREKIKPLIDEMKALRKKMDTIREANMKDFEAILTPEQKEIFDKIKAKRKAKFENMKKGHHHRHHRPMPPLPME